MALRWFLPFKNALNFGEREKRTTPTSTHTEDEAKCTNFVGYPDGKKGLKSSKGTCNGQPQGEKWTKGFQMPLHYPRYKKEEYEKMEEWKVDLLLREYGLIVNGSVHEKRAYAIGAFLWPDQL